MNIYKKCTGCGEQQDEVLFGDLCGHCKIRLWPDPYAQMRARPEFDAIWDVIKSWDINVPHAYSGYCGATGNHVAAIMNEFIRRGLVVLQNRPLVDLQKVGKVDDSESV